MRKCLKLLMFALLRSSACCSIRQQAATTKTTTSIQLRLATRTDVPAIQRCNLACLPENYNSNFYCSHLRQWPDLALVAEEIQHPLPSERSSDSASASRRHFPGFSSASVQPNEPRIVAYVLGKVETRPTLNYNDPTSMSRQGGNRVERLGHVTSLAVQKDFRRLGLARAMMTQLHYHLQHHGIASCGLHVRTSNLAACRLYRDDGYEVDQIIEGYYQDGEDAYFMKRNFRRETEDNGFNTSNFHGNSGPNKFDPGLYRPGRLVKKAWKHGPAELRLPRIHVPTTTTTTTMQKELMEEQSNRHHPPGNPPAQGHAPPSAEILSGI